MENFIFGVLYFVKLKNSFQYMYSMHSWTQKDLLRIKILLAAN